MKCVRWIGLVALLLLVGRLAAQPVVDEKARDLVSLGKKMFVNSNWRDAANSFELATQRPENELTSYAWYMAGLSYFNMGNQTKAEESFAMLLKQYPSTKYAEEVAYHRAILLLESARTNDRDRGLDQMFSLLSKSSNAAFKKTVEQTLRHFLFNKFDAGYLTLYRTFAKEEYKLLFAEAICYQYDKKSDGAKVLAEVKAFAEKGGKPSAYLSGLKTKYESGRTISTSRLNIAVFLALHTERADTATVFPSKSNASIEMLEGMMLAMDSLGPGLNKEINLKVFDTRSDTVYTRSLLDSLSAFNPDIIFSDIRTYVSMILSDWAEKRKVPLLVPRNTLNELITGKKYTFLLHPSVNTMGKKIAEHMVKTEGKRTMTVFNDKSYYSDRFTKAFVQAGQAAGATVTEKSISKEPGKVRSEASIEAKNIKTAGTEVVYVPISNEESAGMIMSYLNYHAAKPIVVGGPDWEMFNVIDPELKTSFQLKYTTLYHDKNDSTAAIELLDRCFDRFAYEATSNTVIGYDIMAWLLSTVKQAPAGTDPAQMIHSAPLYRGIHQDFHFGDQQDNQQVNIVQFRKGRLDKVNGN